MTTVYKLTDQDGWTRRGWLNACQWKEGVTHRATGIGGLCTAGCIHAYVSPELALFMNPVHANIKNPLVFQGKMEITHRDKCDLKIGGKALTIEKRLKAVVPTLRQCVCFAILAAQAAFNLVESSTLGRRKRTYLKNKAKWDGWASDYLAGRPGATDAAANAAVYAAYAADAAANAAVYAAYAAVYAAYAADAAANAAVYAADAAYAAASAAVYAADAAYAAANAAGYAQKRLDLAAIAKEAMKIGGKK